MQFIVLLPIFLQTFDITCHDSIGLGINHQFNIFDSSSKPRRLRSFIKFPNITQYYNINTGRNKCNDTAPKP